MMSRKDGIRVALTRFGVLTRQVLELERESNQISNRRRQELAMLRRYLRLEKVEEEDLPSMPNSPQKDGDKAQKILDLWGDSEGSPKRRLEVPLSLIPTTLLPGDPRERN